MGVVFELADLSSGSFDSFMTFLINIREHFCISNLLVVCLPLGISDNSHFSSGLRPAGWCVNRTQLSLLLIINSALVPAYDFLNKLKGSLKLHDLAKINGVG